MKPTDTSKSTYDMCPQEDHVIVVRPQASYSRRVAGQLQPI